MRRKIPGPPYIMSPLLSSGKALLPTWKKNIRKMKKKLMMQAKTYVEKLIIFKMQTIPNEKEISKAFSSF